MLKQLVNIVTTVYESVKGIYHISFVKSALSLLGQLWFGPL
jgi:hypothetical protein